MQLDSDLYYKSGDTITSSGTPAFGFVTGGGATLDVFFVPQKKIKTSGVTFTCSSFGTGGLRIASGGYIPNQPTEANVTLVREQYGYILIRSTVSGGLGVTNNTPVAGTIAFSITMS